MITSLRPRAETQMDSFALDPYCKLYLPLWKLDGDSFMSKDAYGHLCSRGNEAYWTPQGWYFDGSNDYLDLPLATMSGMEEAGTLLFWLKADWSPQGNTDIRLIGTDHSAGGNSEIRTWGTNVGFFLPNGATTVAVSSIGATPEDNIWYLFHCRWLYDAGATQTSLEAGHNAQGIESKTLANKVVVPDTSIWLARHNTNYLAATYGAVLFYRRCLALPEIANHYIVGKELFG